MDSQCKITVELDGETTNIGLGPKLGATVRSFLVLLDVIAIPDADYTIRLDLDESICDESLRRAA